VCLQFRQKACKLVIFWPTEFRVLELDSKFALLFIVTKEKAKIFISQSWQLHRCRSSFFVLLQFCVSTLQHPQLWPLTLSIQNAAMSSATLAYVWYVNDDQAPIGYLSRGDCVACYLKALAGIFNELKLHQTFRCLGITGILTEHCLHYCLAVTITVVPFFNLVCLCVFVCTHCTKRHRI